MSKASKKKKVVIEERYHGPLITNGVSLGYIKLLPWITLGVSFIGFFGTTYIDRIGIYKILFIICMFISGVAIPLSFFDRFIVRFKSFIYLFVSILVLILNVDMTFIGLLMLVGNDGIYSVWALIYNLVALCILLFSTGLYSWYYLPKNQGKIWAFNRWETYGGDDNDKKHERSFNFGVASVAVVLAPAILTGYIENIFGVFLGILMNLFLPALIVDGVQAARYVRKHSEYEE
jgi:putative lipoprotein